LYEDTIPEGLFWCLSQIDATAWNSAWHRANAQEKTLNEEMDGWKK
jgi:hypothetical protein